MRLWDISGGLLYALEQGTEPPKLSGRFIVAVEHLYPSPAQLQYGRNFHLGLKNSQENPWNTLTECCSAILKCHNALINDCGVDVDNRMVASSWMSCSQKCHSAWEGKPITGTKTQNDLKTLRSHMELIAYWVADIPNVFETAESNTRHEAAKAHSQGPHSSSQRNG